MPIFKKCSSSTLFYKLFKMVTASRLIMYPCLPNFSPQILTDSISINTQALKRLPPFYQSITFTVLLFGCQMLEIAQQCATSH